MAETAIQFLERWRQAHVYAELRALEQLDETVAECIGAAAEDGISADDLEKAAGGSLKEYLCTAIINTSSEMRPEDMIDYAVHVMPMPRVSSLKPSSFC